MSVNQIRGKYSCSTPFFFLLTAHSHPHTAAIQYNNHEVNGKRVVIILDLEILGYTEERIVIEAEVKCVYLNQ